MAQAAKRIEPPCPSSASPPAATGARLQSAATGPKDFAVRLKNIFLGCLNYTA
jgi:hypothetical protein